MKIVEIVIAKMKKVERMICVSLSNFIAKLVLSMPKFGHFYAILSTKGTKNNFLQVQLMKIVEIVIANVKKVERMICVSLFELYRKIGA